MFHAKIEVEHKVLLFGTVWEQAGRQRKDKTRPVSWELLPVAYYKVSKPAQLSRTSLERGEMFQRLHFSLFQENRVTSSGCCFCKTLPSEIEVYFLCGYVSPRCHLKKRENSLYLRKTPIESSLRGPIGAAVCKAGENDGGF